MMQKGWINTAGQTLRRLRRRQGMTLAQMSTAVGISVPVLSRKERDKQALERSDIRTIIERFHLGRCEAYELWTMAGFVPEPHSLPMHTTDPHDYAEHHLLPMPFPACLLCEYGYVLAWNEPLEGIWHTSALPVRPLHVLDLVFRVRVSPENMDQWDVLARQMMRLFHQRVPHLPDPAQFEHLLTTLYRRYGEAFGARWHALHAGSYAASHQPEASASEMLVEQHSHAGTITYIILHGTTLTPQDFELLVLVPFGTESLSRYQQMIVDSAAHGLYFPQP
jgi:hypothetical protein